MNPKALGLKSFRFYILISLCYCSFPSFQYYIVYDSIVLSFYGSIGETNPQSVSRSLAENLQQVPAHSSLLQLATPRQQTSLDLKP